MEIDEGAMPAELAAPQPISSTQMKKCYHGISTEPPVTRPVYPSEMEIDEQRIPAELPATIPVYPTDMEVDNQFEYQAAQPVSFARTQAGEATCQVSIDLGPRGQIVFTL